MQRRVPGDTEEWLEDKAKNFYLQSLPLKWVKCINKLDNYIKKLNRA